MLFDKIHYATQYYRAPTPLPTEWEGDLALLKDLNIDTIQIRMNWRWNERQENKYDFSDVDRLMDLAEKHNKKVIIKLLLECAPQYIFDKYDGARIGPKGEIFHGGANGAFYGGFRPCFTNPKVQKRAVKFVETVAKRYKDRKNLIFWNAWNEIRNMPAEDCFCPHCRAAFGRYLKKKFGTIEKLNEFYGTAENSFATIALPAMPHGYWDIFEFKKFKGGVELYNWLKFVYNAIRKYDKTRLIMSHTGCTSLFQDTIIDTCDDVVVSKAVDFWGTSIPTSTNMHAHTRRMDFLMLNDFLRTVDENYFLYEIYPGLGKYGEYDDRFDMKFKLYSALASGAKGFNYWQLRAERVGSEADCAGLARMDGTFRPITEEVSSFGNVLKKDMPLWVSSKAKPADIAIVFDYDSSLLSAIEDYCGAQFTFERSKNARRYFNNAQEGIYRLLRKENYNVDFVLTVNPEQLEKYKVLYFPYYTMLDRNLIPHLQSFLEKGGVILADEGFGLRQSNTWIQPYDIDCKPLMKARVAERRLCQNETIQCYEKQVPIAPFKTIYNVENSSVVLTFNDASPALQKVDYGKGSLYLFGFSIGYSYKQTQDAVWEEFFKEILRKANVEQYLYADGEALYEKRLVCDNGNEIVFLFNNAESEKILSLKETLTFGGGEGVLNGNVLTLPPHSVAYLIKD